jgi:transcriptional regulator with XRE-family HTH domain
MLTWGIIKYQLEKGKHVMENNQDLKFREIFGKRLKQLRLENGFELKPLAAELRLKYNIEISYGSIANYERAFRVPTLSLLAKIADFFDVSTDYLMGITDVKNAKVLQTSIFDSEGKEHNVKVAVDKDSDLAKMPVGEVIELIKKIKNLGIDFNNIK